MVNLKEVLNSPKLYKKEDIEKHTLGEQIEIIIEGMKLEIYSVVDPLNKSDSGTKDFFKDLPIDIYKKAKVKEVTFAINGDLSLQNHNSLKLTGIILSQVQYFIQDILEEYTIIIITPADFMESRLKSYKRFMQNIARFVPELVYVPTNNELYHIYTSATKDVVNAIIREAEKKKKKSFKEMLDTPKEFTTVYDKDIIYSTPFKIGEHTITIKAIKDHSFFNTLHFLIKELQHLSYDSLSKFNENHFNIIEKYCGEIDLSNKCTIWNLSFKIKETNTKVIPTHNEGLRIISQVVHFMKEMVEKLDEFYLIRFYPYVPEKERIRAYNYFYEKISRIVPGLQRVVSKTNHYGSIEYIVGTSTAKQFIYELAKEPLIGNSIKKKELKELFNSNISINWHPESDSLLQVAYFFINNILYVFRAVDSNQKRVSFDKLIKKYSLPDDIKIWRVGFSLLDLEDVPDISKENIKQYNIDEFLYLPDKNIITNSGNTASVMTGLVEVFKQLHTKFPKDIIAFQGVPDQKSRAKVYTTLVHNTKRFIPDCSGLVIDNNYYVIPDVYNTIGDN